MNAEDQSAASDATEQTAPQVDSAEQQTAQPGSLATLIMQQATEEDSETGDPKPPEVAPLTARRPWG